MPSIAAVGLRDLFRCPLSNDFTAPAAALRAHINHPIGSLYDLQIVLNDNDGIPSINKFMQNLQQLFDIIKMKSGRRLIQNVNRFTGRATRQLFRQFDTLRLTT